MNCVWCSQGLPSMCTSGCATRKEPNEAQRAVQQSSMPQLLPEREPQESIEFVDDNDQELSDLRPSARGRTAAGRTKTRGTKRDAALKDHQSTGRKRAARLYPIDREAPCEWRGLSNCGGGTRPIIGCIDGKQRDRHHGPDKVTTNNEEGNVHRICPACHHRWHAANDKLYDWNNPLPTQYSPHRPRPMTEDEKAKAVLQGLEYLASKPKRVRD